jgi:acyl-CoA thioester hydrolase
MNNISRSSPSGRHIFPVRIYYEDTDPAGIVYYANYLKFTERARTELLREMNVAHEYIKDAFGVAFVVRGCEVEYLKPARLDDLVEVVTGVKSIKGASFILSQDVERDGEVLVTTEIRIACIDEEGRAARIPAAVRSAMAAFIESTEEV